MAAYRCEVCDYLYDEDKEGTRWEELPDDWVCPVCGSGKEYFQQAGDTAASEAEPEVKSEQVDDDGKYRQLSDEQEKHMADIHRMAETGRSITEPMRTGTEGISFDDVHGLSIDDLRTTNSEISNHTAIRHI